MPAFFANNPFLRLVIPFLAGIIFCLTFKCSINVWPVVCLALSVLLLLSFRKVQSRLHAYFFIFTADIFLFFFAIQTVRLAHPSNDNAFYARHVESDSLYTFLVTADDLPVNTGKFTKCHLLIRGVLTDSSISPVNGNLIGYFRGGAEIQAGDEFLVRARLLSPELPKNPYEFDYRSYLANNKIYHTFFADSSDYKKLQYTSSLNPLWLFGLKLKYKLVSLLEDSGLSRDAAAICSALLTGYDFEIDEDITESFSHSGTLHVLSVSGLHTGLIYLCIIFILDQIDRGKKLKILRYLLVLTVLWTFALITGFNAPVLRAVIMFSLLGFGKIVYRAGSRDQINILIITAFLMLCYNPWYLTDIGFQLSFLAVAGIFIFQPLFSSLYTPKSAIAGWLWQGTATSFSATVATLPVTLFYFKQFPLWFFLTNLVVVPATFLLLLLSVFAMLKVSFVVSLMNLIVVYLIKFIDLFNSPRWGYIDNIDFRLADSLMLGILLLTALFISHYRTYKSVVVFFLILIFWQVNSFFVSLETKSTKQISVYQIRKEAAVSVKNTSRVILNDISNKKFRYHVKPHLVSFNYCDTLIRNFNFVASGKQEFLWLQHKKSWPAPALSKITHLCISNNVGLTEEELSNFTNIRVIICDGTNNGFTKRKLAELCSKFGIALYDTHYRGAFIASLK